MKTIIIKRNIDYFFKYHQEKTYVFLGERFKDNIIEKIIFKYNFLCLPFMYGKWKTKLKGVEKVILFDSGYVIGIAKYIKKYNPNISIVMFFWNQITESNAYILDDAYIDQMYSFDESDVEKYGLIFNTTLFSYKVKKRKENIMQDLVFVGRGKNRSRLVRDIETALTNRGYKCDINIIENENGLMSYEECLNKVEKSKCILDIVNKDQRGLTLRCMESLFLSKKLITNSQWIKKVDFYHPSNIFIVKDIREDIEAIEKFLKVPYVDIDKKIMDYYSFDEWLQRF